MKKQRERKVIKKSDHCWLVNLSVSFNIKNPREKSLLEHAENLIESSRWSGEMKRLFEQSLNGPNLESTIFPTSIEDVYLLKHPNNDSEVETVQELFDSVAAFM